MPVSTATEMATNQASVSTAAQSRGPNALLVDPGGQLSGLLAPAFGAAHVRALMLDHPGGQPGQQQARTHTPPARAR